MSAGVTGVEKKDKNTMICAFFPAGLHIQLSFNKWFDGVKLFWYLSAPLHVCAFRVGFH